MFTPTGCYLTRDTQRLRDLQTPENCIASLNPVSRLYVSTPDRLQDVVERFPARSSHGSTSSPHTALHAATFSTSTDAQRGEGAQGRLRDTPKNAKQRNHPAHSRPKLQRRQPAPTHPVRVLDLCAGAGGWQVAAAKCGLHTHRRIDLSSQTRRQRAARPGARADTGGTTVAHWHAFVARMATCRRALP